MVKLERVAVYFDDDLLLGHVPLHWDELSYAREVDVKETFRPVLNHLMDLRGLVHDIDRDIVAFLFKRLCYRILDSFTVLKALVGNLRKSQLVNLICEQGSCWRRRVVIVRVKETLALSGIRFSLNSPLLSEAGTLPDGGRLCLEFALTKARRVGIK